MNSLQKQSQDFIRQYGKQMGIIMLVVALFFLLYLLGRIYIGKPFFP